MTGRQFEDYLVNVLYTHGFWAHRIAPDEAGQQPFDIIALKGDMTCAYDAKVLSVGKRFPLSRIEENQLNAFSIFKHRVWYTDIGCLIYHDGNIRYLSIDAIEEALKNDVASIDVRQLPAWVVPK